MLTIHWEHIPFIRRMLAKAWRNGYNAGFDDGDKLSWYEHNLDLGYKVGQHPSEAQNPYGDI